MNRINLFFLVLALRPVISIAQETHAVRAAAPFQWPRSEASAVRGNALPSKEISSFLQKLIDAFSPPAPEGDGAPVQVAEFRFVPLEPDKFYLVAQVSGRVASSLDVIAPVGDGFRYTELQSDGSIPFAMQTPDISGDGTRQLVTATRPAGYQGASTPPIYWYTVWRFHEGIAEDVSEHFPEFYRSFVLSQLSYPETLLKVLQNQDPEGARVPLAEIDYVRLRFQRTVLKEDNAGLNEALTWINSGKSALEVMGIWSLAQMPAPAAGQELTKLAASPVWGDLAKAALASRAQLISVVGAER
jgi:hypothetical protein